MKKTTVYLPPQLKTALRRLARRRKCSEAEILREAVARLTEESEAPAPRLPLFRSSGPSIAEGIDRVLADGFGVR
jgi:Arc/MetJ-type ribon-helix-helix transcriptional regulator